MLRRWRGVWARRGEFFQVPPATPVIPGIIEQSGSRPRWAALIRRGRFFAPPWPQITQAPSVWTPSLIQASRRLAGRPARRGRFIEPPWPAIAAPAAPSFVPRLLASHRPQPGPPRRGRFCSVPTGLGPPPAFVCIRRRGMGFRARRGRLFDPPWPQVAQQPSVWRPGPVTARRRAPAILARRGQFNEPPWPFVPPPPFTVGVLTATDMPAAVLTAAGAGGPTAATDSAGLDVAIDQATGRLTATDKAGGPS